MSNDLLNAASMNVPDIKSWRLSYSAVDWLSTVPESL